VATEVFIRQPRVAINDPRPQHALDYLSSPTAPAASDNGVRGEQQPHEDDLQPEMETSVDLDPPAQSAPEASDDAAHFLGTSASVPGEDQVDVVLIEDEYASAPPPTNTVLSDTHAYLGLQFTASQSELAAHCNVCAEAYTLGDTLIRTVCLHLFHNVCFQRWLLETNACVRCPECNVSLHVSWERTRLANHEGAEPLSPGHQA
jgi:hypothetical protein